jgi:putative oxidoreductase
MRIVAGFLYACHGAQKLFGVLGGQSELHDPEGLLAGLIEFFGGSQISVGMFTRVAAFVASGEMAVAYFKAHAPRGLWPILNRGELAVLYCFVFLFISICNPMKGDHPRSCASVFACATHQAGASEIATYSTLP